MQARAEENLALATRPKSMVGYAPLRSAFSPPYISHGRDARATGGSGFFALGEA